MFNNQANRLGALLALLLWAACGYAQEGYRIDVQLEGFDQDSIYLAYYLGDKQYIKDTIHRESDGHFLIQGEEPLPGGMYLVVMPPDNQYLQVLVDEANQQFGIRADLADPTASMQVSGSAENTLFYDYLNFLNERRREAEGLKEAGQEPGPEAFADLNRRVSERQEQLMQEHPGSFTAAIIRANLPLGEPDFSGTEAEVQEKRWRYSQQHFFDNIDLADPRMLRTPFLFERVDYYVNKLQVQHPDTLARAIDGVLEKMRPAPAVFQYYLVHFLNTYAASQVVGQDAIYVHLAERYYATGEADWTDEEQREEIVENARRLEPLLIGKKAPDIEMQRPDGSPVSLYAVEAPITILYFWRYDCSHCQKSTPHMKAFYEAYKDRGVKIFAVCVKRDEDELKACWDYVGENGLGEWIQTGDPGYKSFFPVKYDIRSTPRIFVLGPDKTILSKSIAAEQLGEVVDMLLEKGSAGTGE